MYFLLFVFIFFALLTIWWFEAKYNYFFDIWTGLKEVCPWIDMQTKFKLAICKVFLVSLGLTLIICIWNAFYSPYFDKYLSFNNWNIELVQQSKDSNSTVDVKEDTSLPLKIEIVNEDSQIGDWGTFGDFIGGTLNPIIGFISILLLFATWKLTRRTLDFTKEELKNSNQILRVQQFDTIFWGLLDHLKKVEDHLHQKNSEGYKFIDDLYNQIFIYKLDETLSYKRKKILSNAEVSQYFMCLYQILKNVEEKIDEDELKKTYSNILRSNVSTKILQILCINCFEKFPEYKEYLEDFGFMEHMPFYIIGNQDLINTKLLECIPSYNIKIFDKSIYLQEYLNDSSLRNFFNGRILTRQDYIELIIRGLPEINEIPISIQISEKIKREFDLVIKIKEDGCLTVFPKNKQNIYGRDADTKILSGEEQTFMPNLKTKGLEFGFANLSIVISSFNSPNIKTEQRNPS